MNENEYFTAAQAILRELEQTVLSIEGSRELLDGIYGAERIFFAGAGRSRLVLGGFAMRLMQLGKTVYMVGDVTTPAIGPGDLLIIASGSGETASMAVIADKARRAGSRSLLITRHVDSTIAGMADVLVRVPDTRTAEGQIGAAAFEQAVMILGDVCAYALARTLAISDVNGVMFSRHANLE